MSIAGQLSLFEIDEDSCSSDGCDAPRHALGFCLKHYKADWYRRNRTQIRSRPQSEDQRRAARARARRHYERIKADPETMARARQQRRDWDRRNPDKVRANRKKQRARRDGATRVEVVDRTVVWDRDQGICHLCSQPADPADWHMDHRVPLARGGEHSYANVAVSHPFCNLSKGANLVVANV